MNVEQPTEQDIIDLFQQAASTVDEVAGQLSDDEWDLPTDCPGWTVKDQLSHVVSYEAAALGRPNAPKDVDVSAYPYVKDPIAEGNEREIEVRRSRSGAEVLAEYREVMQKRLAQISSSDLSKPLDESETPIGLSGIPWVKFLPTRIIDFFYHEQDMRRGAGKPGQLNGAVARAVFERMATRSLPGYAKWLKSVPDGTVVAFDVEQPGRSFAIVVQNGKGRFTEPPSEPTVRLTSDFEAFFLLIGGRKPFEELRRTSRVTVEGDADVADAVLAQISVLA